MNLRSQIFSKSFLRALDTSPYPCAFRIWVCESWVYESWVCENGSVWVLSNFLHICSLISLMRVDPAQFQEMEWVRCAYDISCNVPATEHLRCQGLSLEYVVHGLLQLNWWSHWPAALNCEPEQLGGEMIIHSNSCNILCPGPTSETIRTRSYSVIVRGLALQQWMFRLLSSNPRHTEGQLPYSSKIKNDF
jgi:hypothetical protein